MTLNIFTRLFIVTKIVDKEMRTVKAGTLDYGYRFSIWPWFCKAILLSSTTARTLFHLVNSRRISPRKREQLHYAVMISTHACVER